MEEENHYTNNAMFSLVAFLIFTESGFVGSWFFSRIRVF